MTPVVMATKFRTKSAKTFECLLHFFKFIRAPTDKLVEPISTFDTSFDAVLRNVVLLGVGKFKFKI